MPLPALPLSLPVGVDPDTGILVPVALIGPVGVAKNYSYDVPSGSCHLLVSWSVRLQSSAAAGNREPVLQLDTPDGPAGMLLPGGGTIAASSVMTVTWGVGLAASSQSATVGGLPNTFVTAPLPWMAFPAGYTWEQYWGNSDAGDDTTGAPVTAWAIEYDLGSAASGGGGGPTPLGPFMWVPGPPAVAA